MTPLELEILLHLYYTRAESSTMQSSAGQNALRGFLKNHLVTGSTCNGEYSLTDKGNKFIEMIRETPLPVQTWIDPRTLTQQEAQR